RLLVSDGQDRFLWSIQDSEINHLTCLELSDRELVTCNYLYMHLLSILGYVQVALKQSTGRYVPVQHQSLLPFSLPSLQPGAQNIVDRQRVHIHDAGHAVPDRFSSKSHNLSLSGSNGFSMPLMFYMAV